MLKKDIRQRDVHSFLIAGIKCFTERLKGAVDFDQSSRGRRSMETSASYSEEFAAGHIMVAARKQLGLEPGGPSP